MRAEACVCTALLSPGRLCVRSTLHAYLRHSRVEDLLRISFVYEDIICRTRRGMAGRSGKDGTLESIKKETKRTTSCRGFRWRSRAWFCWPSSRLTLESSQAAAKVPMAITRLVLLAELAADTRAIAGYAPGSDDGAVVSSR